MEEQRVLRKAEQRAFQAKMAECDAALRLFERRGDVSSECNVAAARARLEKGRFVDAHRGRAAVARRRGRLQAVPPARERPAAPRRGERVLEEHPEHRAGEALDLGRGAASGEADWPNQHRT